MEKVRIVEIHLAIPKRVVTQVVIDELAAIGLKKAKWFLAVEDVRDENMSCNAQTPPTGHDIEDPGMMFTTKVKTVEEGIALVKAGMGVLRGLKVYGNRSEERRVGKECRSR